MKISHTFFGWVRFTIGEILLLMLAAGMGLGWYREHQYVAPMREALTSIAEVVEPDHPLAGTGRMEVVKGEFRGVRYSILAINRDDWKGSRFELWADGEDRDNGIIATWDEK